MLAFVATILSCAKSTISLMMMGPSSYRLLVSGLYGNFMILFGTSSQFVVDQSSVLKMTRRGLFMNKYIFPGADASCPLNWVIGRVSLFYSAEFSRLSPVIQFDSLMVSASRLNLL